jgi:hypothetical protein
MSSGAFPQTLRLDDLYRMVASIYADQNIARSPAATFGHFLEVCGMLTMHDRKKRREVDITVTDALCKALGWYFPLMAKMRVKSVEELIYRKYPYARPYCGLAPHRDSNCNLFRGSVLSIAEVQGGIRDRLRRRAARLGGCRAQGR